MIIYDDHRFSCDVCQRGHRNMCCNHVHRTLYEVRKIGRPRSIRQSKNINSKSLNGKQVAQNEGDIRLRVELSTGTILIYYGTGDLKGIRDRLSGLGETELIVELGKFSKNSTPTQYLARPLKMNIIPYDKPVSHRKGNSNNKWTRNYSGILTSDGLSPQQQIPEPYPLLTDEQSNSDIYFSNIQAQPQTGAQVPVQRPGMDCMVGPYDQHNSYGQKMYYRFPPLPAQPPQSQIQNFSPDEKAIYNQDIYGNMGLYLNNSLFLSDPTHDSAQLQSFPTKEHYHNLVYDMHDQTFHQRNDGTEQSYIVPPKAQ